MVTQSAIIAFASFAVQVSATGCWNSQCTNAAGEWGWCENCDGGVLTGCCAPQYTQGCVDGKGCTCSSYQCGTLSSTNDSTVVALTAEVRGSGCWNQHAADAAGNWGWCESCSGGLTGCCTPDKTYGCVDGKDCHCSEYNVPNGMSEALTVATEVRGDGCWNQHSADSAGNWGWCMHCSGGLTECCTADKTYGCDGGQNCQCSEYNIPNGMSQALALATKAEVRGDGCWNQHAADSAGNWGWCMHCSGGLTQCCTADKTYGCDGGQNCQCSEYNIPNGMSQALSLATEVEVRGDGCWNQHAADSAGNWGWCMHCSSGLTQCCTADKTYGCDGGQNCKCSEYNVLDGLSLAANSSARGDGGCWNSQSADAAGNWGWCEDCTGGNLQWCCHASCTSSCVDGKGCKCSSYLPSNGKCPTEIAV